MKKNLFRLLAGILAIAMMMALAACSGGDSSGSSSSSSESSAVSEDSGSSESGSSSEAGSEVSTDENGLVDGKYPSIQAFLDDPQISEQINQMVDSLAEGDLNIDVHADGDKLVYTFTFAEFPEGTDMAAISASLEENMDNQASVFENIATSMKEVVNEADPKVRVAYNAADGSEIYSREFTAG